MELAGTRILKFLGSGNAYNTELDNNSAYYKEDDFLFLIDCGSNIFKKILQQNLLKEIKRVNVLITHTHPDHVGSLGDLIFYCYYKLNIKINIIYPKINNVSSLLFKMGVTSEKYNIRENKKTFIIQMNNLKNIEIETIEQNHIDFFDNYGYILKINNYTCFYSGDSNEIKDEILNRIDEFHFLYQDTCKLDFNNNPHLSLNKLCKYIEPSYRKKVYCMHLDEVFDREKAIDLGFNVVKNEY